MSNHFTDCVKQIIFYILNSTRLIGFLFFISLSLCFFSSSPALKIRFWKLKLLSHCNYFIEYLQMTATNYSNRFWNSLSLTYTNFIKLFFWLWSSLNFVCDLISLHFQFSSVSLYLFLSLYLCNIEWSFWIIYL